MLEDPESHRMARFAGQRVRMVEAIVELRDRRPCRVARLVYEMLSFDGEGRLDRVAFERQNAALVDTVVGEPRTSDATIGDASRRFVGRGGRWTPKPSMARLIERAALGELKCERL